MRHNHETQNHPKTILFEDYARLAESTDQFALEDLTPITLGLFGEIGSIMAIAKKLLRDKQTHNNHKIKIEIEEEFGDALWYFSAFCRRLDFNLGEVFHSATRSENYSTLIAATDLPNSSISEVSSRKVVTTGDEILLELGRITAELTTLPLHDKSKAKQKLIAFADCYMHAMQRFDISLAVVKKTNMEKIKEQFLEYNP